MPFEQFSILTVDYRGAGDSQKGSPRVPWILGKNQGP